MGLRGNITTRLKQCAAYADDIMLTTRTKQSLRDNIGSIWTDCTWSENKMYWIYEL